jgi:hypothetical protein
LAFEKIPGCVWGATLAGVFSVRAYAHLLKWAGSKEPHEHAKAQLSRVEHDGRILVSDEHAQQSGAIHDLAPRLV